MIQIGQIVVLPDRGYARVFARHGSYVGVEVLSLATDSPRRYVWVEEKVIRAEEPPSEEEVAFG